MANHGWSVRGFFPTYQDQRSNHQSSQRIRNPLRTQTQFNRHAFKSFPSHQKNLNLRGSPPFQSSVQQAKYQKFWPNTFSKHQSLDSWAKKVATSSNCIPIATKNKSYVPLKQSLSFKQQPHCQRLQDCPPPAIGLPCRGSHTTGLPYRGLRTTSFRNSFPPWPMPTFESKDQKWNRKSMGSKMFVLPFDSLNPTIDHLKENAFFAKWCGTRGSSKNILYWWKSSFPDLISVRQMQNDFLFIECVDVPLKKAITKGSPLFFQGSTFHFLDWKPGFDPVQHRFDKTPIWLSLVGLPSKFWCPKSLLKIGDALGFLVGIEADFLKGLKGDIAKIYVETDLSKGFYSELEIISELGRWKQKVIRLGNGVPSKCLLRNQIVNNSSLVTSLGALNLPLQQSELIITSPKDLGSGNYSGPSYFSLSPGCFDAPSAAPTQSFSFSSYLKR